MPRAKLDSALALIFLLCSMFLQISALAKPNLVRHALITPAPAADVVELRKRANANTCAYIGGDPSESHSSQKIVITSRKFPGRPADMIA